MSRLVEGLGRALEGDRVTLAHGNGGRLMRELIDGVFRRHLANPLLDTTVDAAVLPPQPGDGRLVMTTDGFTVEPLEFPGGDIGSLAVNGTINDLAVAGARPLYLTLNCFLEEGLSFALLDRLIASMAAAAAASAVPVVAGDTKIVRRGEGGGAYFATTGVGVRDPDLDLGIARIRAGDRLIVSGPVGDHGTAVLLAREQFGLRGDLRSDCASVLPITTALTTLPGLRFMRDPTRGGLATVVNEISRVAGMGVRLQAAAIPVHDPVAAVCEMLGYDPLYLACEGRVLAVVAAEDADAALAAMQAADGGAEAAIVGEMRPGAAEVVVETELGGERLIEELEDDPLPRIC